MNFNGTGTIAIQASFNVSSITDNGVGDYGVNFTTAMADVNYSSAANGYAGAGLAGSSGFLVYELGVNNTTSSRTVSSMRLAALNASFAPSDAILLSASVFR